MEKLDKYVPREYLALKINYCKKQLELLPKIKVYNHTSGSSTCIRYIVGNRRYEANSEKGQQYHSMLIKRTELERRLAVYEAMWNYYFISPPLEECVPHDANRTLWIAPDKQVVLDKVFFDSLENDANADHPKYKNYYFNGIYYQSAAERDIAIFYTKAGIPFKYEPAVTLLGLNKPIHPDFVLYIEELNTCKFHEHFGMKDSSAYNRNISVKYGNYANAGLILGIDAIFTYDTEDLPFDIRFLEAQLNSCIYDTTLLF